MPSYNSALRYAIENNLLAMDEADWEEDKHPRSKNGQFTKKGTGTSGASASKKKTKSGPKDFLKKLDSISNTKNLSDKDKSVINSIFEKGKLKARKRK